MAFFSCLQGGRGHCIKINLSCWKVPKYRTNDLTLSLFFYQIVRKNFQQLYFSPFKISDDFCGGDEACKVSRKMFSFSLFDDRTYQYMIIQFSCIGAVTFTNDPD